MTPTPLTENPAELSKIYQTRFSGQTEYRMGVWKILIRRLFSQWIPKDGEGPVGAAIVDDDNFMGDFFQFKL